MNNNSNSNSVPTTVGQEVHYTGDMANHEGTGRVLSISSDEWGTWIAMEIDADNCLDGDGNVIDEYSVARREIRVSTSAFSDGPGRRFWLLADWQLDRAERIAARTTESVEDVLVKIQALAKAEKIQALAKAE